MARAALTVVSTTELITTPIYDRMVAAIKEAYDVDELKNIQATAAAIEAYSRMMNNVESEQMAVRIRLRSERRVGELLKTMERATAKDNLSRGNTALPRGKTPTLSDVGLTKKQSSDYQAMADVPEDQFDKALEEPGVTTAKIVAIGRRHRNPEPPKKQGDPQSLWVWGRVLDWNREGVLDRDPKEVVAGMNDNMRAALKEHGPRILNWLKEAIKYV